MNLCRPRTDEKTQKFSVFCPLTSSDFKEQIRSIAKILIRKFEKSLKERNIKLTVTDNAMDYIGEKGYDIEYGARPLRRVIEQEVEDKVAEGIIAGRVVDNSSVVVDYVEGSIVVY